MQTNLTRVRRHPERGIYTAQTIAAILDEGMVAHLGFTDGDTPVVIPTAYGRDGDVLFLHGSAAARWAKLLARGARVCVTVTLLDGLVLARSTFKHSMNYRSVMIFGEAVPVEERGEKLRGLERIVEHLVPGRSREARPPNDDELKATSVLRLSLAEASAKVRSGGPVDDEGDRAREVWAGVLPVHTLYGPPLPDEGSPSAPDYVRSYAR